VDTPSTLVSFSADGGVRVTCGFFGLRDREQHVEEVNSCPKDASFHLGVEYYQGEERYPAPTFADHRPWAGRGEPLVATWDRMAESSTRSGGVSGQEFGMEDLRLIGVQEDGQHLLLSGPDGEHYRLVLDDALRAAARRDRPGLGQLQIEMEGGMRPREVQALIRAGATAEEVAERAGWTVEKVRPYEVPIIAERVHIAEQARLVRVRSRGGSGPGGSGGSGGSMAPTLQGRVAQRMRERGVDPDRNVWDSWRAVEERHWTVVLTFAAGGRQRQAVWTYDPVLRTVEPAEDEARWLSADEPVAVGPLPAVPPRASSVYDVEAEGGVAASPRRPGARSTHEEEPLDLMTAMRQRTTVGRRAGRRRSGSHEPVRREIAPALPLEGDSHLEPAVEPPVEPSPVESPIAHADLEPEIEPPGAESPPLEDERVEAGSAEESVEESFEEPVEEPIEESADEPIEGRAPSSEEEPAAEPADDEAEASDWEAVTAARSSEPTPLTKKSAARRKQRPSVPSWDDIMFGTKRD
jgi:hypothetical protein